MEDNDCEGVEPNYDCENYGDQGITAGCKDIYYYNIDCQWIDITDLEVGNNTKLGEIDANNLRGFKLEREMAISHSVKVKVCKRDYCPNQFIFLKLSSNKM